MYENFEFALLERRIAELNDNEESGSYFSRDQEDCPSQSLESETSIKMKEYL
jgi:hypothetical protein